MIDKNALLALFTKMYVEKWTYAWGAARRGAVDCSGAFVYAYQMLGGPRLEHSSNSMARYDIGPFTKEPKPGYAAFKWRTVGEKTPERWRSDMKGDFFHVGLVDETGQYVLNAKSSKLGFGRDPILTYTHFAPLLAVDYFEADQKLQHKELARVATMDTGLNLRTGPGTGYQKIGMLRKGAVVEVLNKVEDEAGDCWAYVSFGGQAGYASMEYLVPEAAPETGITPTVVVGGEAKQAKTTMLIADNGVTIALLGKWRVYEGYPGDDGFEEAKD